MVVFSYNANDTERLKKKNKKEQDMIMTKIVYGFFYLVSLLPFRVLYVLSDIEYLIVYDLLRYRRKIVRKNLVTSFPEKSETEILQIEKGFYHWFCDYFFEAVKLLSISEEHLKKHFKVNNVEEVEDCFENGQNVAQCWDITVTGNGSPVWGFTS